MVSGTYAPPTGAPPQLELLYRSGLGQNAILAKGSLPDSVTTHPRFGTFQAAVTEATAAEFRLHLGSQLRTAGQTLVVSGIIRPRHAGSSFWTVDPVAVRRNWSSRRGPPRPTGAPPRSSARTSFTPCSST